MGGCVYVGRARGRPILTCVSSTVAIGGDSDFYPAADEDPMTPDEFSALAMAFGPGVQTKTIFETVQFRAAGKAFATLGWPVGGWAVIKVAPSQQPWSLSLSDAVAPEPGRRRKAGIMLIRLSGLETSVAVELLGAAWTYAHRERGKPGRLRSREEVSRVAAALG
jgi:hypothetical protein